MSLRIGIIILCMHLLVQVTFAEDRLRKAVEGITKRTIQLMDERGLKSLTILGVEDGTTYGATAASGVEKMLKDQFAAAGRHKDARGDVGLKGRILTAKPEVPKGTSDGYAEMMEGIRNLKIELQFTDMDGEPLPKWDGDYYLDRPDQDTIDIDTRIGRDGRKKDRIHVARAAFSQEIQSPEAVLIAFGGNGEFDKRTADTLKSPQAVISGGNIAKVNEESDFGVRILTLKGVKPLRMVDGQPFVDLDNGEEFTIDVMNASENHVAATLTVDGLNTFYFSKTPQAHGTSWIIAPPNIPGGSSRLSLEGWYVRKGIADKFVATEFANSKRKEAGLGEMPIGAISVVISQANVDSKEQLYTIKVPSKVEILTVDGKMTTTETIHTEVRTSMTYIGGSGETKQREGDPSKYNPGAPLEIVTIRYRHPRS